MIGDNTVGDSPLNQIVWDVGLGAVDIPGNHVAITIEFNDWAEFILTDW